MSKLKLLYALLLAGFSPALFAADRALLVGIGNYPSKEHFLPGIDKDLALFKSSLLAIGFSQDSILVLKDREATYPAIRKGVQEWLTKGVRENDRVVFFFSGHGSTMRDAGRDVGALIPYDIQVENGNLKQALKGLELGELLSHSGSRHILVVVDACHSGRLTEKSLNAGVVPKFFGYAGMPTEEPDFEVLFSKDIKAVSNHVVLAACKRNEVAGATPNGSVLTVSIQSRVAELARQCQRVTVKNIYVAELGDPRSRQHPEFSGDPSLYEYDWNTSCRTTARRRDSPAPSAAPAPREAPTRPTPQTTPQPTRIDSSDADVVYQIYSATAHGLPVQLSKDLYREGETMEITVDVPTDGYLNIVSVGDNEPTASILFPNRYAPDNFVHAGRITVPGSPALFRLRQGLPQGMDSQNNAVLVLFSAVADNFYKDGIGDGAFRLLGPRTRGTAVEPNANAFTSELKYYQIVH